MFLRVRVRVRVRVSNNTCYIFHSSFFFIVLRISTIPLMKVLVRCIFIFESEIHFLHFCYGIIFYTRLFQRRVSPPREASSRLVFQWQEAIACFPYFGPTTHLDFARLKRLKYLSPLLPVCFLYALRSAQTVDVS